MGESIVMFKRIELVSEDVKSVTNAQKAQILMNALPYIKKYSNKIVVVKYGGNAMINEDLRKSVMGDIVLLNLIGVKVVLVHGGGPHIKETLNKLGMESKFLNGLRVTDAETMKVVQMVLAGQVNKDLVNLIGTIGGKAIGLCGIDGNMIQVHTKNEKLGLVGEIDHIDTDVIDSALSTGFIPIISSVGIDSKGQPHNINADTAATKIAAALNAECLVFMSNIDGVMKDPKDKDSLLHKLTVVETEALKKDGTINGGMIPKVDACTDAIKDGVKKVFIINGEVPHALLIELLTNEGLGTMFVE